MNILKAGGAYFASVFTVGFALGTLRVLLLEPSFGALGAVFLELPFMLGASWVLCRHWTRRFDISPNTPARLSMGALAFTLLITAEILLGLYGFDRSLADQFHAFGTAHGGAGLAGQLLFGFIPALQGAREKPR